MKSTTFVIQGLLLAALFFSCKSENKSTETADSAFAARPAAASVADASSLAVISPNSFRGISPGDEIATHEAELAKGELVRGGSAFTVYNLTDETDHHLGYLRPDSSDERRVGEVIITSSIPATTEGIRVGMTLGDLQDRYRNLQIHGSETDGQIRASKDQLSFRLNAQNKSYQLDPETIPLNTKIIEISINRPGVE